MAFTDAENELALREGMAELLKENSSDDRTPPLLYPGRRYDFRFGKTDD